MQELGQLLLFVSFFVTLATVLTAIVGAVTRNAALIRGARSGLYTAMLVNIAMAVVLIHGFLTHDFGSKYIAAYSDRSMPTVYLLAAFWGGEKGALLFWVTSLSVFGSIAIFTKRERSPIYLSWVIAIIGAAILFFLVLMVFESSPFETFMTSAGPDDGQGLNPLLQNPVMAVHPPSLLTGYILFTIPFAFGMAALISNRLDEQWITDTRRWTIVSWTFLSIGLLLGARWAYMEIGWGFWWMWDPVENAGFIPWLTATAFLHSVMIQERRGMLKRWNVILLALTFLLTIVGTFLTRSQLIVSIHAFADSKLPNYFFFYMVVIFVVSAALITWRWRSLRSEAHIESVLSRESAFVLNNVVFVFAAFIVLWGTLMGKITESPAVQSVLGLSEAQVWDESKFNEIMVPVGVLLLVLMGIGPLISWRRASAKNFRRNFVPPLAVAGVVTGVITGIAVLLRVFHHAKVYDLDFGAAYAHWSRGVDFGDALSVVVYFLCAFVVFSVFREFHVGTRVRGTKSSGGYFANLVALTVKNPRRYGGYLIHLGMVMMFIAFTGKAFQVEEKDRLVTLGDVHVIDDYSISLVDRHRLWNADEGCVSNTATFVVMPLGTTVAQREVDATVAWLQRRDAGVFHVKTAPDNPKITVRFKAPAARSALLTDVYLARRFLPSFRLVAHDDRAFAMTWTASDVRLVRTRPDLAMQQLREARERLTSADPLGLTATLAGGSPDITLTFDDEAHRVAFVQRLARIELAAALGATLTADGVDPPHLARTYAVADDGDARLLTVAVGGAGLGATALPSQDGAAGRVVVHFDDQRAYDAFETTLARVGIPATVVTVLDAPELGAVEVVDARTGKPLVPESRFYPRKGMPTTEVAISSADFLVDVYLSMQPSEDPAYVKLYTVIFPLVNCLWLGGMFLLFGAAIALIPRWLGRTLAAMTHEY